MYNSRSHRRVGYDGYRQRSFALPENYSGNAFREDEPEILPDEIPTDEMPLSDAEYEMPPQESDAAEEIYAEEAVPTVKKAEEAPHKRGGSLLPKAGFGLDIGKLFRGGLGFEELLIIGLILLIAQSENNEDMIVLLALLLFVN